MHIATTDDAIAWGVPAELVVVRHGQSTGNAALAAADAAGSQDAGITERNPDIPLSPLGREQAGDLGRWFASLPPERIPQIIKSSPYVRARDTADIVRDELARAGRAVPPPVLDERLRDRETGVLNGLPSAARQARFPDEVRRRAHLGELYYRPPGGESLTDVALRLRSFLRDVCREQAGRRVLVAAHDAVVIMLRFVLEGLTETELVALSGSVANASVTRWVADAGRLRLAEYNRTGHLQPGHLQPGRLRSGQPLGGDLLGCHPASGHPGAGIG
ncbi:histidine phosphatase family protein [Protofrankia coriariae]|uniref:histidine phosphatase family protein n=1 Tax=Protofrankia coriariae TaxID=1562887 RepID=UPI000A31F708|nr:histidine phosphatase family protein [Protofrankia coriariae]